MTDKTLMREFSKADLLKLTQELGIEADYNTGLVLLLELITDDLEENGIPEKDECSTLLDDFLYKAKFVSEDGELLEKDESVKEVVEIVEEDDKVDVYPQCWSMADIRAPECKRCILYSQCNEQRVTLRPPCYGKQFEAKDEECQRCIENSYCRAVLEKEVKTNAT